MEVDARVEAPGDGDVDRGALGERRVRLDVAGLSRANNRRRGLGREPRAPLGLPRRVEREAAALFFISLSPGNLDVRHAVFSKVLPQRLLVAVRRQVLDEEARRAVGHFVDELSAAPWGGQRWPRLVASDARSPGALCYGSQGFKPRVGGTARLVAN